MQTAPETTPRRGIHIPIWLGFCLFLAIAAFFLWEEHRAHILGAVPYLLLLLCPVIHVFVHRGHGGHNAGHSGHDGRPDHSARQVLVSQIGRAACDPQVVDVCLAGDGHTSAMVVREAVADIVQSQLRSFAELREALLDERVRVF